jgi:hypothetical protein
MSKSNIIRKFNDSYYSNLKTNYKDYKMKKFYLLFVVVLISSTSLFAQRQGISIGGNVVLPVGDWAEVSEIGFGGSATYEHPLAKNVLGVLYSGYTYFGGSDEGFNWTMIPVVAGVKVYLDPKQDWYIAGLLGASFQTYNYRSILGDGSESSTEFAGNANFGYELKTAENGAMDFSAGFVFINEQSYIGVRIAYIFKL